MKKLLSLTFVLFLSISGFAHTNEEVERELLALHGEIEKYSSYSGEYSEESDANLAEANKAFRLKLLSLTAQHPSTLDYAFPKLNEELSIESSPDSRLRIYSWDRLTGGTMHFYQSVYQYRGTNGVFSRKSIYEEGDAGGFANSIAPVETGRAPIYLVSTTAVLSSSLRGEALRAFRVDGDSLNVGIKIFKTGSGMTDTISFGYDFFSVVDREERPVRLFKYDPKSRSLSFPVVIEDDKNPQGRVTSAKIVYRYSGEYFVRVKN